MIVTRPSFSWITAGVWLMPLSFAATAVSLMGAFWREALLRLQAREVGVWPRTTIGRAWLLLLLLGLGSTARSLRPLESLFGWLGGLGYAITFTVATWTIVTPGRLKQLHKALFQVAVAMAVFGLAVYAADLHWRWHLSPELEVVIGTADRRVNSVMYHPNLFAGFLVLAMGAGLGLFHQMASRPRKAAIAVGLVLVGLALVLTASRAGWIGAGVLLSLFGLLVDRRWLLVLVGGAACAVAVFPQMVVARLAALAWDNPAFDRYRLMGWISARDMVAARPLTGWGPGTWEVAYPPFRLPEETVHLPHAHNYFLHVAAEFGIPVIVTLTAIIAAVLWRGLRETRQTQYHLPVAATGCTMAGYLVTNMFDYTLSEGRNAMAFFLLLGGVEAARRMARADRPPELRLAPPGPGAGPPGETP
ncbi:MAG: O-antigen ligase family protein [Candidatus Sericytochromatia bacterium]|nr:O-antigen ligase family protein [Candidatus Sericytochromatia bacterium]